MDSIMQPFIIKIIAVTVLYIAVFISGYWLSHLGNPVNTAIFTTHKLIALAAVIYSGMVIVQLQRSMGMGRWLYLWLGLSSVFILALFITGALLSREMDLPAVVHYIHKVVPYLTIASLCMTIYLFVSKKY